MLGLSLSTPRSQRSQHSLQQAIRLACYFSAVSALAVVALPAVAADHMHVEEIEVEGIASDTRMALDSMRDRMAKDGVSFYQTGGIAALPVINGMNDDRVRVTLDGASITAACANHMNPVLSYVDFSAITDIQVVAGITPVSVGGDSIAGTISLQSEQGRFAERDDQVGAFGKMGFDYNSNGDRQRATLQAGYSERTFSLVYNGFIEKSESYEDGNGDKVLDTLYRAENHSLTAAWRGDDQELSIKLTRQEVPYQGFPNQYMDMVGNDSNGININYQHGFDWGTLYTQAAWQQVDHAMGFFTAEKPGIMPMLTEGMDANYSIRADIVLQDNHTLTLGQEYFVFTLDDYWPAVPGNMMMGPDTYVNIKDGQRERLAVFAESDYRFNTTWSMLAGIRVEGVESDAGEVKPYNSMMPGSGMGMAPGMGGMTMTNLDAPAAMAFNSQDHRRDETNVDLSLMLNYTPGDSFQAEFGYARKNRSPSLYERYSWGRGTMAMTMIGWYGDANGYVGDTALNRETAHTLGAKLSWADPVNASWHVELSPYYTKVDDFIDANVIGTFNPRMQMQVTRPLLQFTNLDATLYGARLDAHKHLGVLGDTGVWDLYASLDIQRGSRDADNSDLYQIMPLQLSLGVENRLGNLQQRLGIDWVDNKSRVDDRRLEPETGIYALLNWQAQYQWHNAILSLQVTNLLDEYYDLPLGGVSYAAWLSGGMQGQYEALAGQGRSMNMGVQFSF